MALKACKECGKEVSTSATKCPHCGVSNPTLKSEDIGRGCLITIGVIVFLAFIITLATDNEPQKPLTAEERRIEKIEDQFSAWDGSHLDLTRIVKDSMNDPDSYEHIETRYSDKGDHLIVIMEFSGLNGFGGRVRNTVRAKTDAQTGKVIEILSQN